MTSSLPGIVPLFCIVVVSIDKVPLKDIHTEAKIFETEVTAW